jgi:Glyoxalase-like domain
MLTFDHLAISCLTLEDGAAQIEAALGVALSPGGQHPRMATHNRLLNLGELYLEVIAPDPSLPAPAWPRWFDLDRFAGPPRLTNWVARCDDLGAELALSPPGSGIPVTLQRSDFRWDMAVPADGRLPFEGTFPALIRWYGQAHPAARLPDAGVRLVRFEIAHPAADVLRSALAGRIDDPRIIITFGAQKAMQATFATPHGQRMIR